MIKKYLISSGITFVSTFGALFFMAISSTDFSLDKSALGALAFSAFLTAVRATAKVLYEMFLELQTKSK